MIWFQREITSVDCRSVGCFSTGRGFVGLLVLVSNLTERKRERKGFWFREKKKEMRERERGPSMMGRKKYR